MPSPCPKSFHSNETLGLLAQTECRVKIAHLPVSRAPGRPALSGASEMPLLCGGALTIRPSFLTLTVNTLLRFRPCPEASAPELMTNFRRINSPVALATCGMFLVPEPFGACLLLAAAVWWLWRKTGCPCRSMVSSFGERVRRGLHWPGAHSSGGAPMILFLVQIPGSALRFLLKASRRAP